MSRGIVLWPDEQTSATITGLWQTLEANGIATLDTETHRLHQPHCSLSVAEHLPADEALSKVGAVPSRPLPFRVESVSVFPPNGAVVLAVVATQALLAEQRRVHQAIAPIAQQPWPYFEPDGWVPHITLTPRLSPAEFNTAIPLITQHLPLHGTFNRGGVEDGSNGESWPAPPT